MIADTFLVHNLQPPGGPASSKRCCSSISQCYKRFRSEKFICLDTLFVTRKKAGIRSHEEWLIVFDHILLVENRINRQYEEISRLSVGIKSGFE